MESLMIVKKIQGLIKKHSLACEVAVSIILTMGLECLFDETKTRNYLMMAFLFVAVSAIVHFGVLNYRRRRLKYSLFYSAPFGLAFWLGQKVVYQNIDIKDFAFVDILLIMALVTIFALASMCVFGFIDRNKCRLKDSKKEKNGRVGWWVYAIIILLCWMPLFLVFFPGLISIDSAVQLRQAVGESVWSNWHPVLHTLFVAIPVNAGMNIFGGDLTAGIALSTITQMLILCMIFGYIVKWVMDLVVKRWVGCLLLVFFAFCPIVACYAVTMWKDVLFSAVFLLLFVELYDLIRKKGRGETIYFGDLWKILLLTVLVGFLRNGGVLIVVGLLIAMLIYYKDSWKIVLSSFGGLIVFIAVVQGPIYNALDIASSPLMESLSVPAQQLGYITKSGRLDDDLRMELKKYADVECLKNNYSPMNADPAKNCFSYTTVDEHKVDFLKLWLKVLPSHLGDYIKSYILQMYSYWYIQGDVWALDFGHTHDEVWLKTEYTDLSLLGDDLRNLIRIKEEELTTTVWFSWMNNVGVMFWAVVYALIVFMYQKRYALLIPMSGILVYMFSLLIASPVSWMFRYVYSLLLVLPILVIICLVDSKKIIKRKR